MVSASDEDVFSLGTLVNNTYRIEKVLGRGGMGEVYLAAHDVTEQRVAIKVLRSEFTQNEMGVELMKREQAVRAVRHDAVIEYFELGRTAGGDIYLVMDYVEGPSLEDAFKQAALAPDQVLRLGRKVAEGLAACHDRGVIHRDLSPDNILLRGGNGDHPVIIDFGIAKDTSASADRTIIGGQFAGKFTYAPPEQFGGQVETRSDLYSLGVTMLAAVRGKAPSFGPNQIEVMKNKGLPVDVSDVPQPLGGVIAALTDPAPANRPASAEALVALIDGAIAGRPQAPAADPEMTVIAMTPGLGSAPDPLDDLGLPGPAAAPAQPAPQPTAPPSQPKPAQESTEFRLSGSHAEPEPAKKGGSGKIALVLGLLAVIGGGVGAWQAGLLDSAFGPEVVSPFRLSAQQENGAVSIAGHVPDEADGRMLSSYLASVYDTPASTLELPVAGGAPTDQLAEALLPLLAPLERLETWSLELVDNTVRVEGLAPDMLSGDTARQALASLSGTAGLSITAEIANGPRELSPEWLSGILAEGGECGPLSLDPPAGEVFALGDTVTVRGEVADGRAGLAVRERLQRAIGDRTLDARLDVLNQPVCQVRRLLPPTPLSELEIVFAVGEDGSERPNPTGGFAVGENPLIDIALPESASWGHLHVAAVDVTGAVFHLLPNQFTPETRLEALGSVANGVRTVRVAHTLAARNADPRLIAFQIDETFGKTLIVAFHTREPLFEDLRDISEGAESFAAALEARIGARPLSGAEIETRMIDTRVE